MPFHNNAKHVMLDELATVAVWASLHTTNTPTTGGSEVSGGSPAYSREAISWNAAASGQATGNVLPTFDVPASTTVQAVGLWSASTAGTFYGYADVTDEVFAGQGTYEVTAATIAITDS